MSNLSLVVTSHNKKQKKKYEAKKNALAWSQLLKEKRQRESGKKLGDKTDQSGDRRNEFEKDYHRIIQSASFRRLQDKTQVFPLDRSDFVRTRLTHSLEVSSLAKSLAQLVCQKIMMIPAEELPPQWRISHDDSVKISDLLLCAGLIHDIGNPPFGHYGETTIRQWFAENLEKYSYKSRTLDSWLNEQQKQDLLHFEGNAQSLRVLSKLHFLVDEFGMNLSYPLLHILIKYPVSSIDVGLYPKDIHYRKMGYFAAEKNLFTDISKNLGTSFTKSDDLTNGLYTNADMQLDLLDSGLSYAVCRHPLTFLLEAADDIAYCTADMEDAYTQGKITYTDLFLAFQKNLNSLKSKPDAHRFMKNQLKLLEDKFKTAIKNDYAKAERYAIQNWLIQVQSCLLEMVADNFILNYEKIMNAEYKQSLFEGCNAEYLRSFLYELEKEKVFLSSQTVKIELVAHRIITGMLDCFIPACINFDNDAEQNPVHKRLMDIVSDNYKQCYWRESKKKPEGEALYLRLLLITDYISGMTDKFARDLYQELNGTK